MKEGACMPIMITRKGQRHARAIHRKECTNRGRREWKVVRYYVKCAPPNETKKEFVSSAHSRTLTLSPFLQKRSEASISEGPTPKESSEGKKTELTANESIEA